MERTNYYSNYKSVKVNKGRLDFGEVDENYNQQIPNFNAKSSTQPYENFLEYGGHHANYRAKMAKNLDLQESSDGKLRIKKAGEEGIGLLENETPSSIKGETENRGNDYTKANITNAHSKYFSSTSTHTPPGNSLAIEKNTKDSRYKHMGELSKSLHISSQLYKGEGGGHESSNKHNENRNVSNYKDFHRDQRTEIYEEDRWHPQNQIIPPPPYMGRSSSLSSHSFLPSSAQPFSPTHPNQHRLSVIKISQSEANQNQLFHKITPNHYHLTSIPKNDDGFENKMENRFKNHFAKKEGVVKTEPSIRMLDKHNRNNSVQRVNYHESSFTEGKAFNKNVNQMLHSIKSEASKINKKYLSLDFDDSQPDMPETPESFEELVDVDEKYNVDKFALSHELNPSDNVEFKFYTNDLQVGQENLHPETSQYIFDQNKMRMSKIKDKSAQKLTNKELYQKLHANRTQQRDSPKQFRKKTMKHRSAMIPDESSNDSENFGDIEEEVVGINIANNVERKHSASFNQNNFKFEIDARTKNVMQPFGDFNEKREGESVHLPCNPEINHQMPTRAQTDYINQLKSAHIKVQAKKKENNHLKKESEELRSDKKELLNEIDNFKALARILIQQNKKLKNENFEFKQKNEKLIVLERRNKNLNEEVRSIRSKNKKLKDKLQEAINVMRESISEEKIEEEEESMEQYISENQYLRELLDLKHEKMEEKMKLVEEEEYAIARNKIMVKKQGSNKKKRKKRVKHNLPKSLSDSANSETEEDDTTSITLSKNIKFLIQNFREAKQAKTSNTKTSPKTALHLNTAPEGSKLSLKDQMQLAKNIKPKTQYLLSISPKNCTSPSFSTLSAEAQSQHSLSDNEHSNTQSFTPFLNTDSSINNINTNTNTNTNNTMTGLGSLSSPHSASSSATASPKTIKSISSPKGFLSFLQNPNPDNRMQSQSQSQSKSPDLHSSPFNLKKRIDQKDMQNQSKKPSDYLMVDELSPCEQTMSIQSPNKREIHQNLHHFAHNFAIDDFADRSRISNIKQIRLFPSAQNKINTDPY